jgi:pyruvate dehydrogenase E2 component (dihydrolipoamide acetyltransferase)
MPIEITLPRQGWSMEEAAFVEWLKEDGEAVKAGEALFAVETDKAVQEIESLDAGILRLPPNGPRKGDMVHVGDVIGYLAQAGEAVSFDGNAGARTSAGGPKAEAWKAAPPADVRPAAGEVPAPAVPARRETPASCPPREVSPVTPRAARKALREGVDLRIVKGTGMGGRIREQDVAAAMRGSEGAADAQTPMPRSPLTPAADREVPVSGLRRAIAERMIRSKTATVPVTLTTRADAGALVCLREQFKATASPDEPAPSYSDLIVKLVALTLVEHPGVNARWEETRIVLAGAVNVGLAVDTEDGLLVPVVRDVPGLTLRQLAARTRDLVERARRRRLTAEDLTGGTFTVTNLGVLGVDAFTPIINHPECAVLGVGRIAREPAVADGQVVIRDRLWLSLTFDHRVVDGAPAARFLDAVRRRVENPAPSLMV